MKRAVHGNVFRTTIKKKSKVEKDKEEGERESFVCHLCLQEIARAQDFLGMYEVEPGPDGIVGFFRNVLNVDQEHSADPGPGHDDFTPHVFCSQCFTILGSFIVRITPLDHPGANLDMVARKYIIIMNWLRIRRGILLLDAVTKEVIGHIQN